MILLLDFEPKAKYFCGGYDTRIIDNPTMLHARNLKGIVLLSKP